MKPYLFVGSLLENRIIPVFLNGGVKWISLEQTLLPCFVTPLGFLQCFVLTNNSKNKNRCVWPRTFGCFSCHSANIDPGCSVGEVHLQTPGAVFLRGVYSLAQSQLDVAPSFEWVSPFWWLLQVTKRKPSFFRIQQKRG